MCTYGSVPLPVTNLVFVTKNYVKEVNLPQFCMINSICVLSFLTGKFTFRPCLIWRKSNWIV